MSTFRRGAFSEIAMTFESLEPLGLLETAYLEDADGVDGQVTLQGPGGLRRALLVTGLDSQHEQFRAFLPLAGLPDGAYTVSGRARDVVGNVAVFSLPFTLASGTGTVVTLPGLRLAGVVTGLRVPASSPAAGPGDPGRPIPYSPSGRVQVALGGQPAYRPLALSPPAQRRGL